LGTRLTEASQERNDPSSLDRQPRLAFCPRPLSHGSVALTFVISTEANPDFLPRGTGQDRVCAFL
jgi:hypothetical protein